MEKKGLTLVRDKGKEIPALVLESALLHFGTMMSIAWAEAPDGVPTVEFLSQNLKEVEHKEGVLGYVKEILNDTKEHKVVLHFSNDAKDPQPFTILHNAKDLPSLVAFMIGDFSEHTDTDGHTVEYAEASEYLTPKILELFEKADDDIVKLTNKLREPNISKELGKMGDGDFLNCTMVASNGDVLAFTRPKTLPIKYDWGHASSDLDEHKEVQKEEPKKEEQPAVPPKELSLKDKLKQKRMQQQGAPAPAPIPEPKKEEPKKVEEKPLPEGVHRVPEPAKGNPMQDLKAKLQARKAAEGGSSDAKDHDDTHVLRLVKIPDHFDKSKNRRKWFAQRGPSGEVNVDFPDWSIRKEPILVPMFKLMQLYPKKTPDELSKIFPAANAEQIEKYKGSTVLLNNEQKPQTSVPVVKKEDVVQKETPGIIPTSHKQHLNERFLKKPRILSLVDKKGQTVMNPDFLPQMEDKLPQFWQSLGLPNLEATDWWKMEDYKEMGQYSLDAVARAAFDEKMNRVKASKRIAELEAEVAKLKGEPLPDTSAKPEGTQTDASKLSLKEKLKLKRAAA